MVASDERSAAGGITNMVRSLGMAAAPLVVGYLSSLPVHSMWFSAPWVIAGGLKIIYDVALYALFLRDTTMREGEERLLQEAAPSVQDAATVVGATQAHGQAGATKNHMHV